MKSQLYGFRYRYLDDTIHQMNTIGPCRIPREWQRGVGSPAMKAESVAMTVAFWKTRFDLGQLHGNQQESSTVKGGPLTTAHMRLSQRHSNVE